MQKAWLALDVPQCGYCQAGQIMAASALLKKKPKPTDADIDAAMTNICRCGTYQPHPRSDPSGRRQHQRRYRRQQGLRRRAMTTTAIPQTLSRRNFLISGAAAGGGLALGFNVPGLDDALAQLGTEGNEVGAWVFIKPNDDVIIRIARSEMGQGTLTGLAQLVAEELECDWTKVKHRISDARPEPGAQPRLGRHGRPAAAAAFAARTTTCARAAPRRADAAAGRRRPVEGAGRPS